MVGWLGNDKDKKQHYPQPMEHSRRAPRGTSVFCLFSHWTLGRHQQPCRTEEDQGQVRGCRPPT